MASASPAATCWARTLLIARATLYPRAHFGHIKGGPQVVSDVREQPVLKSANFFGKKNVSKFKKVV